ncbi:hypothetical protein GCM10010495_54690 [Kitasatospora herbaricolor]|uniref:hypothetical protein n=1 Tax=Kitasatospora herbaricolor TaxID=68217 RepID=UPI00199AC6E2|nr:hypothetical protein [Kitasatospora herbaricolor]MDQ0307207.1 hypothetical protein [Kitasatospora herbaricolor]GGV31240.1 hypothetical protein GCM10010495_54690 [Kitasatospora herbaricolor]
MSRTPNETEHAALRTVRRRLWIFVVCLVLSGLTAFPLETETRWLADFATGPAASVSERLPGLLAKLLQVRDGIADTNHRYPFLAYGTDWLAFAHLVIAVAFWGPIKDPVRNVWVVRWAVIACGAIIPLALVCGPLRGIPPYWRFIDMSFGVIGVIPLLMVLRGIRAIERIQERDAERANERDGERDAGRGIGQGTGRDRGREAGQPAAGTAATA